MYCRPLFLFVPLWLSASSSRGAHLRTAASESTIDAEANADILKHRRLPPETGKNYREKEKVSPPCPYTETWQKLSPCSKTCGDSGSLTVSTKTLPVTSSRKLQELTTASYASPGRTLLATSFGNPPIECVMLLRIQPCPNYPPCPAVVQPGAASVGRFRRNVKRRERNRERKFESRRRDYLDQEQDTEEVTQDTPGAVQLAEETSTAAETAPAADQETPAPAAETPVAAAEESTAAPVETRATRKPVVLSGDDDLLRGMFSDGLGAWHVTQIIYIISGILLFLVILIAGGIVLVVVRRRKRRRLEGSALSRSRAGGTSRQTGYSTSRQTAAASRQTAAASKPMAAASTVKAAQSTVPAKS